PESRQREEQRRRGEEEERHPAVERGARDAHEVEDRLRLPLHGPDVPERRVGPFEELRRAAPDAEREREGGDEERGGEEPERGPRIAREREAEPDARPGREGDRRAGEPGSGERAAAGA